MIRSALGHPPPLPLPLMCVCDCVVLAMFRGMATAPGAANVHGSSLQCYDGGLKVVEFTWIYPVYMTFFMVTYFLLSFVCGRPVVELWQRTKKVALPSNRYACVIPFGPFSPHPPSPFTLRRYQVLFVLCIGAFVRALGFLRLTCFYQEVRTHHASSRSLALLA